MKQSLGLGLILIGGIMFHIAASSALPQTFSDVWKDLLALMSSGTAGLDGNGSESGANLGPVNGGLPA